MKYINVIREILSDPRLTIPLLILIGLLIYSYIYPMTFTIDPGRWYQVPRSQPPSYRYPFGTTTTGQDVFLLVPVALRNSITIGFIAAIITTIIAFILASLATLVRSSIIRGIVSTFIDVMCMIPVLPILIVVIYAWRRYLTLPTIGIVIGLINWPFTARTLRGFLESLKTRSFVYTSQLSGLSTLEILYKDILPYTYRYMMVGLVGSMLGAIGYETTVAFFGAMKMEIPTIGTTIYWALNYNAILTGVWWWIAFPVLFLAIFVITLYIFVLQIDRYLGTRIG